MKKSTRIFLSLSSIFFLSSILPACGSNSSGTTETVNGADIGISTVTNLPLPFDPVQTITATSSMSSLRANAADTTSSGIMLNNFTSSSYGSQNSSVSCQSTTQLLRALDILNGGQLAYCALKFVGDEIATAVPDLYSGNFTVFDLIFTQNGVAVPEASSRVKMKVIRDAETNVISSFTMYICGPKHSPSDGTYKTLNYVNASIAADGTFSLMLKGGDGSGPDRDPQGWHVGTINGTLEFSQSNSSDTNSVIGTFTGTKTISVEQTNVNGDTFYSSGEFVQTANTLDYQGYSVLEHGGSITNTQTHSLMDINDGNTGDNYDIGKMILSNGGGILKAQYSYPPNTSQDYDATVTEGWNGNTLLPDNAAENFSGNTFLSLISGFSVPDLPSTPLPDTLNGFNANEEDDCVAENAPTVTVEATPYQEFCMNSIEWSPSQDDSCYGVTHPN